MVSDVDTDDLNGGADHGGGGGERNLLGERLVERCDLLGEVVAVRGDDCDEPPASSWPVIAVPGDIGDQPGLERLDLKAPRRLTYVDQHPVDLQ